MRHGGEGDKVGQAALPGARMEAMATSSSWMLVCVHRSDTLGRWYTAKCPRDLLPLLVRVRAKVCWAQP